MVSRRAFLSPVFAFLCLLGCAVLSWGASARGDWWMANHDARHTGQSTFHGPANPHQVWACTAGATGVSTSGPVIAADGTIYIGSYYASSDTYALSAINSDGTLKWNCPINPGMGELTTPAIGDDGTIYIGGDMLYAVTPAGQIRWSYPTHGAYTSPVIGADGTIYVDDSQTLYAINPDGSLKWSYAVNCYLPAISPDGTIYVTAITNDQRNNSLVALDASGAVKWTFDLRTYWGGSAPPVVGTDGTVYIGTTWGTLCAINPNGVLKWTANVGGSTTRCPAMDVNGTIYVNGYNRLYAINPDGSQKWAYTSFVASNASPTVDRDGVVYIETCDDYLLAINADGTLKWSITTPCCLFSPVTLGANGVIYLEPYQGYLLAYADTPPQTLSLTNSASAKEAAIGDTVTYTLQYTNTSSGPLTNVILTDELASDWLNYIPGSAGDGSYDAGTHTLTWMLDEIAPGATGQVSFQVTVGSNAYVHSRVQNIATLACTERSALYVSNSAGFSVTGPGNDPPMIDQLPDQTVPEDAGPITLPLTGILPGDADDAGQTLTITAITDNPALIPTPTINYTNPQTTGTLTFQPAPGHAGKARISLHIQDNGNGPNGWYMTFIVTVTPTAKEGDVSPNGTGDGQVTIADWVQIGRFAAGLDTPPNDVFQRADCAPLSTKGDGKVSIADWVQAGRFAVGLDALTSAGGPTAPVITTGHRASVVARTPRTMSLAPTTLTRGKAGTVRMVLNAQGNESAVGFTLNFNPRQMKFMGAKLVGATSSAMLDLNTRQVASGSVGVALLLPLPKAIPAGRQPIIELTFQPLIRGLAPLTFTDQLVTRELAGITATALPVSFVNGMVVIR